MINLEILGRRNIASVLYGQRVELGAFDGPHFPVRLDLSVVQQVPNLLLCENLLQR